MLLLLEMLGNESGLLLIREAEPPLFQLSDVLVGSEEGLFEVDDALFPFFEGLLHLFEERLVL